MLKETDTMDVIRDLLYKLDVPFIERTDGTILIDDNGKYGEGLPTYQQFETRIDDLKTYFNQLNDWLEIVQDNQKVLCQHLGVELVEETKKVAKKL